MKKLFTLLLFGLSLTEISFAQNKRYTMKEAVLGLHQDLQPKNIAQTTWIPNQNTFTEVSQSGDKIALLKIKVPGMTKDTLFTLSNINQQLFGSDSLKTIPTIHWFDAENLYFKQGSILYSGNNFAGIWHFKSWLSLPKGTDNYFVDNVGKQVAYTSANNLYLINGYGKKETITNEKNPWIVSGQIVSRNEFGIDSGVFFSPKGNFVAFYQMDETGVKDYPIIDWSVVPAKAKTIKYPMAGGTSQKVRLGVFNPITGETVFMKTGINTDHYLTNVTWGPGEKYLYIGILNRDQNDLKLNKYDARTGNYIKTLFEESNPKYVHPMNPLYFIPGQNNQFIWWSERDGYMHLYRYDTSGKLINKITSGKWLVNNIDGWNNKGHEIIISSSKLSPMDKTIYAVNWLDGKMRRLDDAPGIHTATVSSNGNYWIDRFSNYHTPRNIDVAATNGKWEKNLLTAPDPLSGYARPIIREVGITAADGYTPLYGRLILPPEFNPEKKYPVIVYLYNGPGIQLLHHSFPESGNLWYDYMAQHGYIIFTMDGRGSSNRGLDFEQVTFRHLGTKEMKDQLEGVAYLKTLSFVDTNRLGVHGWSFGGFMTVSLMLRHPGVFKVAVAGGPVIDWRMYEVMYTERYMDSPQENPEGYEESSLLDKTKNLNGKLLVIHGAQDSTVVWQHSMRFLRSCVENNVLLDYFVYPAHPHNVRGKDRVHLMEKITDYFNEHLK